MKIESLKIIETTPPNLAMEKLLALLHSEGLEFDDLKQALIESAGEARGNELMRRFGAAFPAAYREDVPARNAVPDCEIHWSCP